MNTRHQSVRSWIFVLAVIAGMLGQITPAAAGQPRDAGIGVTTLTGTINLPPDQMESYPETYVLLSDYGSVLDGKPVPSVESQVIAGLIPDGSRYRFSLALPIQPQGTLFDVETGAFDDGPQIFTVDIVSNLSGDTFLNQTDAFGGGIQTVASSLLLAENDRPRGQLIVWSPNDEFSFSTDPGADGELLTDDDPVAPLDAGWTVVQLGRGDFEFVRENETRVLFPQELLGGFDFSNRTYTGAFDDLLNFLEDNYVFTDLKGIDYDALRAEYRPRIEDAESDEDLDAFTEAIYLLSLEFDDGHVSASLPLEYVQQQAAGSFGLTLGETDDGEVLVTNVTPDSSAADAGIEPGDEVVAWDGQPIDDAISEIVPLQSTSSEYARRGLQVRQITRGPIGNSAEVTLASGRRETTVELEATFDLDGLVALFTPIFPANDAALPVEVELLPSGLGYIRITGFVTDNVLFSRSWDYAIRTLTDLGAPGLVLDIRGNGGGDPWPAFYAGGSFTDDEFVLDTGYTYVLSDDGDLVEIGDEVVEVTPVQWDGPVSVIIDADCASACEQLAASLANTDSSEVIELIGHTPTAGVYAGVLPISLPDGVQFQASLIRYEVDGEIYLEGEGVPPTIHVPVTEAILLADGDVLLLEAQRALGADLPDLPDEPDAPLGPNDVALYAAA